MAGFEVTLYGRFWLTPEDVAYGWSRISSMFILLPNVF